MSKDRDSRGVFVKGHSTSEKVRNQIAETLDKTGDLAGRRFGSWMVIERRLTRNGVRYWFCHCDCGVEKEVGQRTLISGRSTGCLKCSGKKHMLRATERCVSSDGRIKYRSTASKYWLLIRRQQFEKQKGICPICLEPLAARLDWDHEHDSGFCRELVHTGCNVFIGFVENHSGILDRVKEYLAKYETGEGQIHDR